MARRLPSCVLRRHFVRSLFFAVTAIVTSIAAIAQDPASAPPNPRDIVGTWQGTLHIPSVNRDLRIVNKISKDDKGKLKVEDYSIDQRSQALVANSVSFEDGVLKYSIDGIQGKYEGKMSADGKTIAGNWTQGPAPLALNLDRANADTAWTIPEPPKSMPADAKPSFDVATIKPSVPNRPGKGFGYDGHHFRTANTNVNDLIAFAMVCMQSRLSGRRTGLEWISSTSRVSLTSQVNPTRNRCR